MTCTTPTGGAQSAECPEGWSCSYDAKMDDAPHCVGKVSGGGGSCAVPCPPGCCSPSGLTCCEPPFCSGDCVGSPCCS